MKYIKRIVVVLLLSLLTTKIIPAHPTNVEMQPLPPYGIFLNDSAIGYTLLIPAYWYAIVPPVEEREIDALFYDIQDWYYAKNVKISMGKDSLKQSPQNLRLFFVYLDSNYQRDDFLPTGFVYVSRSPIDDFQPALKWAQLELLESSNLKSPELKNDKTVQLIEGIARGYNNERMYIQIAYFRCYAGLVIVPITSPTSQKNLIQTSMNQIIDSIK